MKKTNKLVAILLTVLFTLMLFLPSMVFAEPDNTVLKVYSGTDYSGTCTYVGLGSYDLSDLETLGYTNDTAVSIKVRNGFKAYLYEHFHFNTTPGDEGGYVKVIDENTELTGIYKNTISSIKVYSSKDCPTPTPTPSPTPTPTPSPTPTPTCPPTPTPTPTVTPTPTLPPFPTLPPTGAGGASGSDNIGYVLFGLLFVTGVVYFALRKPKNNSNDFDLD